MHETLCNKVKAHIDTYDPDGSMTGWCYHVEQGVLPLRISTYDGHLDVSVIQRNDVANFFKKPEFNACGWSVNTGNLEDCTLEMFISNVWTPILELKKNKVNTKHLVEMDLFTPYKLPRFVVVDNFYSNPDIMRQFALSQDFKENPGYHKGKRCINPVFLFPGLKEQFEKILGQKIADWTRYPTNGCFQYCIAGEQAVYQCDTQQYAGVLFLTPDAPPETGTRFYRSKATKKMKVAPGEYGSVFPTGHLDSTPFEQVDVVGNVYNRLVLFDANMIHAAPLYFGNDLQNGRLFQLFFFDLEV